MKRFLPILLLMVSCQEQAVTQDFDDRILDFVIETRNGRTIAFPDLYGRTFEIPDAKNEKLILSEKLKSRGFTVTETTSNIQGFTGIRSVTQKLVKDGCDCQVTKTYGRTAYVSEYAVTETISCSPNL
ncbi:hypothetical protein FLLO111716_13170 [Flavobacterium longum]|uniref:hypothetical protein n=1 Tax=Flavobacterium longum TaxID=1299340 RepID=UPI0039EA3211